MSGQESLPDESYPGTFPALDNRDETHAWVRRTCDHPYVHGLVDDIFDLVAAGDRLADLVDEFADDPDAAEALGKWSECRDR